MDRILHTTHGNPGRGYYPQNKVELPKDSVVDIVSADRVSDYVLAIKFSDDHESRVDFQIFLTNSRSPHIRSYLDLNRFDAFRIESGDLVWGDYEMCFPIADLYEGKV